jgi:hypothetical protein
MNRTWTVEVRKVVTAKRRSTGVKSFGFCVGRSRPSFRKVKHDVVSAAMAISWSLEKFEEKR